MKIRWIYDCINVAACTVTCRSTTTLQCLGWICNSYFSICPTSTKEAFTNPQFSYTKIILNTLLLSYHLNHFSLVMKRSQNVFILFYLFIFTYLYMWPSHPRVTLMLDPVLVICKTDIVDTMHKTLYMISQSYIEQLLRNNYRLIKKCMTSSNTSVFDVISTRSLKK